MCNKRTDILDNGARDSFHYEGKYKHSKHPLAISIHPGCHRHKNEQSEEIKKLQVCMEQNL